jgi:hypothetical protein
LSAILPRRSRLSLCCRCCLLCSRSGNSILFRGFGR